MKLRLLVPAVALCSVSAFGQEAADMLNGGGRPLTMKASGLNDSFHAVQIKTGAGGGGILDMMGGPMMMIFGMMGAMGGDSKDQPPFGLFTAMDISWTTGETAIFFGQSFLVTYKMDMDFATISKMGPNTKDFSGMDLRLQLVKTEAIQTFTPRPDVTPSVFAQMLKVPTPAPVAKPAKPAKP